MKVLLAPREFQGSLTAAEVVDTWKGLSDREYIQYDGLPLAYGGDGSVQAAIEAGFRQMRITVAGATGHEWPTTAALRRHHRRHRGRQHLRTAHPPQRKAGTAGSHQQRSWAGDCFAAAAQPQPDRPGPRRGPPAPTVAPGMLAALGARFLDDTDQMLRQRRHAAPDPVDRHHQPGRLHRRRDRHRQRRAESPHRTPATAPLPSTVRRRGNPGNATVLDDGLTHLVQQLTLAGFAKAEQFAATPGAGAAGGLGFAGALLGGRTVSGADDPRPTGLRHPPAGL